MTQDNPYRPPQAEVADIRIDHGSDSADLATRGERFWGALVDGVCILAITVPVMIYAGYWRDAMNGVQAPFATQLLYAAFGFAIYVVLNGYLLSTSGQTIGKWMAGTRIVSIADNRILPLWKILALRQLPVDAIGQIPLIGPILTLVEVLFVFRADRRCVHDLIAGTRVIRAAAAWKKSDERVAE